MKDFVGFQLKDGQILGPIGRGKHLPEYFFLEGPGGHVPADAQHSGHAAQFVGLVIFIVPAVKLLIQLDRSVDGND